MNSKTPSENRRPAWTDGVSTRVVLVSRPDSWEQRSASNPSGSINPAFRPGVGIPAAHHRLVSLLLVSVVAGDEPRESRARAMITIAEAKYSQ